MSASAAETVVIVGGAIVGTCTAFFLRELGFGGRIVVLERDPTYRTSSTALSAASIRTQFDCAVNVRMSLFGAAFLRGLKDRFGPEADVGFVERGYLILGPPEEAGPRRAGAAMQVAQGAEVRVMDPGDVARDFPWIDVADLGIATFGTRNEGWFDAWSLLHLVKRAARDWGVEYVTAAATGWQAEGGRVRAVRLADGGTIAAEWFVNAAGPSSGALGRDIGIALPVSPRKRTVFSIKAPLDGRGCPMLFDTSGAWIRPEGEGFITGIAPSPGADPDAEGDFDPDFDLWEEVLWPALAHRVPALASVRVERAWAGHYEVNALDQNGIVGPHDELPNLLFATGFSGHGVMHAPATGRGIAELIVSGAYTTLDLAALGFARIRAGRPLTETVVY